MAGPNLESLPSYIENVQLPQIEANYETILEAAHNILKLAASNGLALVETPGFLGALFNVLHKETDGMKLWVVHVLERLCRFKECLPKITQYPDLVASFSKLIKLDNRNIAGAAYDVIRQLTLFEGENNFNGSINFYSPYGHPNIVFINDEVANSSDYKP